MLAPSSVCSSAPASHPPVVFPAAKSRPRFATAFPEHKANDSDCVPTPPAVVRDMIRMADFRPGMTVLEPSAGTGNIAGEIRKQDVNLQCVEFDGILADSLRQQGYRVQQGDFLQHAGAYDRILMNPPFSKGQCMAHVRHAYSLLKPGGRLLSVVPWYVLEGKKSGKVKAFHAWLQSLPGGYRFVPIQPELFVNEESSVTRPLPSFILQIDKPANPARRLDIVA